MAEPMPCPTYSSRMPSSSPGCAETKSSMASPMSPTWVADAKAAMPTQSASRVIAERRSSAGSAVPAAEEPRITVRAESACQPSTIAPPSTFSTSPVCRTRSPGMPCTTSSLTEVQIEAGKS